MKKYRTAIFGAAVGRKKRNDFVFSLSARVGG
jgi:hypothetical protein